MMKIFLSVVLFSLVISVTSSKKCHSEQDLCVPVKHCPHIYDAIMSSEAHTNRTLSRYIWSRVCHTPGVESEPRVCCNPTKTAKGKHCTTQSGKAGKCVSAERCSAADENRISNVIEDKDICYEEKGKNYYCCAESFTIRTPAKKQRHISEDKLLKTVNKFHSCHDSEGEPGFCVPVRNCDAVYSSFLDGRIQRDAKLARSVRSSRCPADVTDGHYVCCPKEHKAALIRHKKAFKLGMEKCGIFKFVDKILRGKPTAMGQYPWMANLMYKRGAILRNLCGGSLVHPRYVVTAAHCMSGSLKPVSVRLGEYDLRTDPDCEDGVCAEKVKEYPIEELIPNPSFDGITASYDIALIRLAEPVEISETGVYPICLPLTESMLMLMPSKMTVTGWGLTEKHKLSDVLLDAELHVVEREDICDQESTFCARGHNQEAHCRGDSGGPYQAVIPYENEYKYVLYGIVSGGPKFCSAKEKMPGVGVMVGYFVNWILDNMDI